MKHYVRLGTHILPVSPEGYTHLTHLMYQYHICRTCEETFCEDNPCVVRDCCLRCFQQKRTWKHLRYVGPELLGMHHLGVFRFLDDRTGDIFLSFSQTDLPWKSASSTLRYWGYHPLTSFTLPTGETIALITLRSEIEGDVRSGKALIVRYFFADESSLAFLLDVDQRCILM